MHVLVLGASGSVGREIVRQGYVRNFRITAQTRAASKLADLPEGVATIEADPLDPRAMARIVRGMDAVIFALGVKETSETTIFSDATRILIAAMETTGVRRLIAITGVGAGETRGHGGLIYDWFIFPLFTRNRYKDKERQEALIEASDLDWIIVRPAPFDETPAGTSLQVHTVIGPHVMLRRITRGEVAAFVLDQLASNRYLRQKPFIGHP